MPHLFSRTNLLERVASTFADPAAIGEKLPDVQLPPEVHTWLSRLRLLSGVPINYLVPDERMLPPESIRFFYLDMNWVDSLIDGAYSLGRNLTQNGGGAKMNVDRAVSPTLHKKTAEGMGAVRAAAFGVPAPTPLLQVVSGFLLRSSVVQTCPGLGVYAYDAAGKNMMLLRFERLGPDSDTLVCIVDGDLGRADIHEPPEGLHYGVDSYTYADGKVTAWKEIHTFEQTGDQVKVDSTPIRKEVSPYFRTVSPRTLRIAALGKFLAGLSNLNLLDAAQMGFEMTQGVGLVSFRKRV